MTQIYAPEGRIARAHEVPTPPTAALSHRRLGILDNTKPNAGVLLHAMASRLAEIAGCRLAAVETKNAAVAAPDQVMGRLTEEVELVLTGSAD